jgi:sterol desaturase/sphingolipid hydroxylase (fatty acid hydroxylase superfamily)
VRRHAALDLGLFAIAWLALAPPTAWWVQWASRDRLGAPLWLETVLALVLLDLGNYVVHWALHRYPLLWRLHALHHSSPVLDWLATFRAHPLEQIVRRLGAPLFVIAAGVSPAAVGLASAIFIAWAIGNHANLRLRLRALDAFAITPHLHWLHHESAEHNFGTVFSVWDRLTGRLMRGT